MASATLPVSTADQVGHSDAIFRGTVVGATTARGNDGLIYTRTALRVTEALKGKFPSVVVVEHRGGQVGNEDEFYGLSPKFIQAGQYLLFVTRDPAGKLRSTQGHASAFRLIPTNSTGAGPAEYDSPGQEILNEVRAMVAAGTTGAGADVTDQADPGIITSQLTTGMLAGINTRFLQPDRGEPIPVLIDAASLPAGITLNQATNAVQQALDAWASVTSLKFQIEGIVSFGQGADTITTPDQKLRIQLHDTYNRINSVNVLGIGGRNAVTSATSAGWDLGGNVAGNEFRRSSYGYVVLEAGAPALQNPVTLAEVLCHEIGHALNMAHSSEVFTSDPVLFNSIMYYQAHKDGRGAALGVYDPPVIQQCYPANTAPYILNPFPLHRVIDATSASSALNLPGINEVEIRGYDLQTSALTVVTNEHSASAGSLALVGNMVKYFPPVGNFADTDRIDPQIDLGVQFMFYAAVYARLTDGTNASPYTMVRVISLRRDGAAPLDGIPDYWMVNYFGSAAPSAGNLSRANDDADGDGLTNLQEYRYGSNPKDASSRLQIADFTGDSLQFQAQGYELYEIMGSTNLTDWQVIKPFSPNITSLAYRTSLPQTNILATVSNLPVTAPQMFYRIRKVP